MAGQQDLPIRESSVIDLSNNNKEKETDEQKTTRLQEAEWERYRKRTNDGIYPPNWPYTSVRPKSALEVHDPVFHPKHYDLFDGEYQVRDLIKDRLTPEEWQGYIKGNMIKYHMRAEHKNGVEDYAKLMEYLKWLIKEDPTDV